MAENPGTQASRFEFREPRFERINPGRAPTPEPTPLIEPPSDRDLALHEKKDCAKLAATSHGQLARDPDPKVRTEVGAALALNYQREVAAGRFHVPSTPDRKRRARWRQYILAMLATNGFFVPLAVISGPHNPFLFVFALAGSAICSSVITWHTWALRTD